MFPGQCGNTAFFFKSQPDQFHFEFRGIVFPGKSFFSAHEVSTCKISGCLSYRILDSGPDGTQTTLTIIRDTKVLITLNLPDGQKTTIEGEWRHMSDANRLSERITMLQHAIYEQYEEYRADIPVSWSR